MDCKEICEKLGKFYKRHGYTEPPWDWQVSDESLVSLGSTAHGARPATEGHVLSAHRCSECIEENAECMWPANGDAAILKHAGRMYELLDTLTHTAVDGTVHSETLTEALGIVMEIKEVLHRELKGFVL